MKKILTPLLFALTTFSLHAEPEDEDEMEMDEITTIPEKKVGASFLKKRGLEIVLIATIVHLYYIARKQQKIIDGLAKGTSHNQDILLEEGSEADPKADLEEGSEADLEEGSEEN